MSLTFPAGRPAEGSKARQVLLTPEILDLDEGED